MKTILCYGDSNTFGFDSTTGGRIPYGMRWPNVLQQQLGGGYHVIEEGINGRTAAEDDPTDDRPEVKNGKKGLVFCLRSHFPLDLVILMLGTNDLKERFFTTAGQVARNVGDLVDLTRQELAGSQDREPEILIAAPMPLGDSIESSPFCAVFGGRKALAPSIELARALRGEAERKSCRFFDAGAVAKPNPVDSVHFSREGHRVFGEAVAREVLKILG